MPCMMTFQFVFADTTASHDLTFSSNKQTVINIDYKIAYIKRVTVTKS